MTAALPPYDHTPVTTEDGLRVTGWSWPPVPVLDEDDRLEKCTACDGDGWFTETTEGSDGRDADVDIECLRCEGSGVEP